MRRMTSVFYSSCCRATLDLNYVNVAPVEPQAHVSTLTEKKIKIKNLSFQQKSKREKLMEDSPSYSKVGYDVHLRLI